MRFSCGRNNLDGATSLRHFFSVGYRTARLPFGFFDRSFASLDQRWYLQ